MWMGEGKGGASPSSPQAVGLFLWEGDVGGAGPSTSHRVSFTLLVLVKNRSEIIARSLA